MSALPGWFGPLVLGFFGLVVGSFANVVIYRLPRGESLSHPPSHCPACGHPIRWWDNVPVVSWLLLGGQCRDCGAPISPRYPLVEAAMGFLWAGAGVWYAMGPRTGPAIVLLSLLLMLSLIDLDTMRLPNALVGLLFGAGVVLAAIAQFTGVPLMPLVPAAANGILAQPLAVALIGVLAGAGLSLGIAQAYSSVRGAQGFGMGDVKLLGAIGVYLGLYVMMVLFVASLVGALWGVASKRVESLRSRMPFGPFIALATVVVLVWGPPAWDWYASLVGLA